MEKIKKIKLYYVSAVLSPAVWMTVYAVAYVLYTRTTANISVDVVWFFAPGILLAGLAVWTIFAKNGTWRALLAAAKSVVVIMGSFLNLVMMVFETEGILLPLFILGAIILVINAASFVFELLLLTRLTVEERANPFKE